MTKKIGISTWAYQDLSLGDALERISSLSDNAEILCEAQHSLLDPSNLEALDSFSLKYTVHGLITDVNIASIHDTIRSASVELHRKAVEESAIAGASVYVVHPGFTSWPFYRNQALHSLDKSLVDLRLMQDEFGISICVENMPKSDWLFYSCPGLNLRGLGTVLDVGHANTCGSLDAFLAEQDISHVHLHDNAGCSDDHLPLGQGSIEFGPVLEMIRTKGISAVLENKSEAAVLESLNVLQSIRPAVRTTEGPSNES
jgi:sugar phosphate isomerase/epimerase